LSERNTLHRAAQTWKHRVAMVLKRVLYARADVVTAVSEGVAAELVEDLKLPVSQVTVVHNPVVTDDVLRGAEQELHDDWFDHEVPVVLAVGRLVPQKDYPTLLEAFRRVHASRPARLVILGEGPDLGSLQSLAGDLGIASDVRFPGFDLNPFRYMSRCACYVLSSKHEGLPGALIQAMACGAPVVSTDCPHGPSEIITDGVSGYLCPVGDANAIAEKVERLLGDSALRARMGANARDAASRFSSDQVVQRYAAVLDGLGSSV
jgi:glycosyltransferase involved in cell wall biosynthesis